MMKQIAAFLFALMLAGPVWAQPNIIVIMTDDQSESLPIEAMPNVKSLIVDQGVRFTNSFTDFPLCCPDRASLFTGLASHNHGIKANQSKGNGGWRAYRPFEANSLPVWLQAAGYRTGLIGKYLNQYDESVVPPGWTRWMSGVGYYGGSTNDDGMLRQFGPGEYSTDVLAVEAVEFINSSTQPFFLMVAPRAPHTADSQKPPAAIPATRHANAPAPNAPRSPSFNEANVKDKPSWVKSLSTLSGSAISDIDTAYRQAYRSLMAVDEMVAVIVAAAPPNTYICYTSDNGFFYGEHRIKEGKIYSYEPSLRVPLICRGPGIPAGETRGGLVNTLDLSATIIDWANATSGRVPDGKSFAPILADANASWRAAIFFSGDKTGNPNSKKSTGVRTLTRKYIKYADGFEELYDMVADPHELVNKKADPTYAADLMALRTLHTQLATCVGEACWIPAEEPPPPSCTCEPQPCTCSCP